jgi:hypothetical protein
VQEFHRLYSENSELEVDLKALSCLQKWGTDGSEKLNKAAAAELKVIADDSSRSRR